MKGPADCDSVAHLVVGAEVLDGDGEAQLADGDHHHLLRVLRVRDGETVTLTDGSGRWAEFVVGKRIASGILDRVGPSMLRSRPPLSGEVAFSLTKSDKPEWVVQKLTELGLSRIVVLSTDRSVARWDAGKVAKNLLRFQVIAKEAVQQSRQLFVPVIGFEQSVAAYLGTLRAVDAGGGPSFARCDRGATPIRKFFDGDGLPASGRLAVAIGPEGGWSEAEAALMPAVVSLGDSVLRAETAAIVAGAAVAEACATGGNRP